MPTPVRPTLAEVARRAGVSVTTASYVVNGQSGRMRIADETQRRVLEAAQAMGYRPNRSARSLRTRSSASIGLVVDNLAGGSVSAMLAGASEAAHRSSRALLMAETGGDRSVEELMITEFSDRQVDGIVYATSLTTEISVPASLAVHDRVVLLNCTDVADQFPSIVPAEDRAGRDVARALLDQGHRRIAVVGEGPSAPAVGAGRRLAGILDEMEKAGVADRMLIECAWDPVAAYAAVYRALGEGARATGLICLNDRVALGTYQALAARGLAVPADMSVVSFDGSDLATWLRPPVTSASLPLAEMGSMAVGLLTEPGDLERRRIEVPMALRPGSSVAAGAAHHV